MEQRERRLRNQQGQLLKGFGAMQSVMLLSEEPAWHFRKVSKGNCVENRKGEVGTLHPNCWDYIELRV